MKFKLIFDCDNAAFAALDDGVIYTETRNREIARIVRELADKLENGVTLYPREPRPIRDINGNVVGAVQLTGRDKAGVRGR